MKQLKSTKMENVKSVIGQNTKQSNTVTMRVTDDTIIEAQKLYKAMKEGNKPETGLIGFELHAVYADEVGMEEKEELILEPGEVVSGEELVDGMNRSLDEVVGGDNG